MVKVMYKERVKSRINPLIAVVIWFFSTYAFTIFWGIAQILFEFESLITMQLICLIETVWFGWFLISKVLTEIEYEIFDGKLTITRYLSKKSTLICIIALDNIKAVSQSKEKCKTHHRGKIKSFVRPGQKEKICYIAYKDEKGTRAVKICASEKLIKHMK